MISFNDLHYTHVILPLCIILPRIILPPPPIIFAPLEMV